VAAAPDGDRGEPRSYGVFLVARTGVVRVRD